MVNKIDFKKLVMFALEPNIVIKKIKEFCYHNFDILPINIAGHNVHFDISFIFKLLGNDFTKLFTHRAIDTASILKYLYLSGKIPEDISSSEKAFKYFNIIVENRHSALGDAKATALLFDKLVKLIK